ncbi:MAG: undecaprenyl-diphosphate phosphatase [Cyclonatronaceae bacterium]
MDFIEAILLGILQGITEFLPVSSSGHLVLAQALLERDIDRSITFEIVVHFGTLFSILIIFRERIRLLIITIVRFLTDPRNMAVNWKNEYNVRFVFYVLLSMIPAMLVGFLLKDYVEAAFASPVLTSSMLLVTGLLLYSTRFTTQNDQNVTAMKGFIIGVSQALAIMPGISRAGTTITTGLFLRLKQTEVADFSFIMLLPVLAGAMLLEIQEIAGNGIESVAAAELTAAFFASFISGVIALKYLIKLLKGKSLHYFAWYCWFVGISGIIYFGFL